MPLDTRSVIPLHAQLKEQIRVRIDKGVYSDRIPSERELMDAFAVSRTTVREAVSALVHEGLLQKIHGKGTFVNSCRVNEWLGTITSFTETVESMGFRPGVRLLIHGRGNAPDVLATLGVDEYYSIERLRFANDIPIAVERTYYPVEIGLKIANYDLNMITIYSVLESNGVILHRAEQRITAGAPSKEDAKVLRISPNSPVLIAERITVDPDNRTVELYRSIFRPDKYAFCVKMFRRPG